MLKTKLIPWLAPLAMLLCAAGCPVDVNEGDGGDDDGSTTPECMSKDLATVRFFHGAGGTPVTRKPGVTSTRNLNIVRTDMGGASPPTVTSIAAGRATIVQLCGNKELVLGARLVGAKQDRTTLTITLTPDADPSKFQVGTTIVLAGISDDVTEAGTGENPASTADPLRFIVVPDTFSDGSETQIQVVHASRLTPSPVDVEANPDSAGVEFTALDRYAATNVALTKGSTDMAPATVPVKFLEGTTARASFTISPRIPAGAKAVAIHFDTEVYDPDNPDPAKRSPAPTPRLFVTGNDPLLGLVAGGGVTF